MSHQQYTSLTREIPENAIVETKFGSAVIVKSLGNGYVVAMVYRMTSGAVILPPCATRRLIWTCEVAS